jgi:5-methylcytosine-specific restriction endonuclease McrA
MAKHQLRIEPLCATCLAAGKVTAATVADHVTPHRGDVNSFWTGRLQSLCSRCHESTKKLVERHGYLPDVGVDGLPIDKNHPVYRRDEWSGT